MSGASITGASPGAAVPGFIPGRPPGGPVSCAGSLALPAMVMPSGYASIPKTAAPTGSWWTLIDILRQDAEERAFWDSQPPQSCPNDGTPLLPAPPSAAGVDLFCPHDGWAYPRDRVA